MKTRRYRVALAALGSLIFLVACSGDNGGGPGAGNASQAEDINGAMVVGAGWGGEWTLELTFRDCDTQAIRAIHTITDVICENDTLAQVTSPLLGECQGSIGDRRLDVSCSHEFDEGPCHVALTFDAEMELEGNMLSGSGRWTAALTGLCDPIFSSAWCEDIEISGVRIGTNPAGCTVQTVPLATRFGLEPRIPRPGGRP